MQTSTLTSSIPSLRGEGQGVRGVATDTFRRQFDSLTGRRGLNDPVGHVYQPQDERTIRFPEGYEKTRRIEEASNRAANSERTRDGNGTEVEGATKPKEAATSEASRPEGESETQPEEKNGHGDSQRNVKARKPTSDDDSAEGTALLSQAVPVLQVEAGAVEETAVAGDEAATKIESSSESASETAQLLALAKGTLKAGDPEATEAAAESVGPKQANTAKPGIKIEQALETPEAIEGQAATEKPIEQATPAGDAGQDASDLLAQTGIKPTTQSKPADEKAATTSFDQQLQTLQTDVASQTKADATSSARISPPQNLTPEQKFLQDNVDQVLTTVRTQSLQGGGQMHVRLDPPELGALQVAVKMVDGRLTASFTTSNEQATQLLSHSLQHLKSSLEAGGVNVDRIEVRQAPQSESSSNNSRSGSDSQQNQQRGFDAQSQQSEQQRKEMVRKMWRKLAYGSDDLDLVA